MGFTMYRILEFSATRFPFDSAIPNVWATFANHLINLRKNSGLKYSRLLVGNHKKHHSFIMKPEHLCKENAVAPSVAYYRSVSPASGNIAFI